MHLLSPLPSGTIPTSLGSRALPWCVHTCHSEMLSHRIPDSWLSPNANCCWAWRSSCLPIKSARGKLDYVKHRFPCCFTGGPVSRPSWDKRPRWVWYVWACGWGWVAGNLSVYIFMPLVMLHSWGASEGAEGNQCALTERQWIVRLPTGTLKCRPLHLRPGKLVGSYGWKMKQAGHSRLLVAWTAFSPNPDSGETDKIRTPDEELNGKT